MNIPFLLAFDGFEFFKTVFLYSSSCSKWVREEIVNLEGLVFIFFKQINEQKKIPFSLLWN